MNDSEYLAELEAIRREGEIALSLSHKSMSNHLAQSVQVIAGLTTMHANEDAELRLLEALVKCPLP